MNFLYKKILNILPKKTQISNFSKPKRLFFLNGYFNVTSQKSPLNKGIYLYQNHKKIFLENWKN